MSSAVQIGVVFARCRHTHCWHAIQLNLKYGTRVRKSFCAPHCGAGCMPGILRSGTALFCRRRDAKHAGSPCAMQNDRKVDEAANNRSMIIGTPNFYHRSHSMALSSNLKNLKNCFLISRDCHHEPNSQLIIFIISRNYLIRLGYVMLC